MTAVHSPQRRHLVQQRARRRKQGVAISLFHLVVLDKSKEQCLREEESLLCSMGDMKNDSRLPIIDGKP